MVTKTKQRIWLKHQRLTKGLTQKDVASKAKIARTTYASIEQGERNASVPTAKAIAEILDFDWTIFFDDQVRVLSSGKNTA
ncbi:helix-turn-helix transcriptional regulator [Bacillus licheniformis]|uniref:helix-turn-helix transcriptional regulator n=1 Tax=Bacillus licheniformis TaxID=1402 RepID=UPI000B8AB08D|nr:helix-turn-helix transcriptional regulator [Bacillus licheniformis]MCA1183437.1 helix-turn-helix transcriptional regulator [Bacillus licheniformis]RCK12292.1 XRE family transcriptional regulator [Bacillus licheniformis]WCO61702.1 helix-turn-helix transcriptional regulator [Bacillus licheniformis]